MAKLAHALKTFYRVQRQAKDPITAPVLLAHIAHLYPSLREEVAHNPSAAPKTLAYLASSWSPIIRRRVAANTSTPPEILAALACDTDFDVRLEVAANPHTPPKAIAQVAFGEDDAVRALVVRALVLENPNTPAWVKVTLSMKEL